MEITEIEGRANAALEDAQRLAKSVEDLITLHVTKALVLELRALRYAIEGKGRT